MSQAIKEALEEAIRLIEWLEIIGKGDGEIFKHEIRAQAEIFGARIRAALASLEAAQEPESAQELLAAITEGYKEWKKEHAIAADVMTELVHMSAFNEGALWYAARANRAAAPQHDFPTWVDKVLTCGNKQVEQAARVLLDWYQGVAPGEEPSKEAEQEQNEFTRCQHRDCGRFKDGAGWGCRAILDNACVRNDAPASNPTIDSKPELVALSRAQVIQFGKEAGLITWVDETGEFFSLTSEQFASPMLERFAALCRCSAPKEPVSLDALPPLPYTTYNGYSDGSEPLYTADQMKEYAQAAISPQPLPVSVEQAIATLYEVCHSDPSAANGEYCITVSELVDFARAIRGEQKGEQL